MAICNKRSRLSRATSEMGEHGIRALGADDPGEILSRRAPDARDTAEGSQQRLAPPWPNAADLVNLGPEVALRARLAMEGNRKPVCLIANALDQQECRTLLRQRNTVDE